MGTMIEALVRGCVRHLLVPVLSCFLSVQLLKAAVPALMLGTVQSLPSYLSKASAVAGTEASSERLPQGAILGEGEQTGNNCTYWCRKGHLNGDCWQARHGKNHLKANANTDCAADQDDQQQMPTV